MEPFEQLRGVGLSNQKATYIRNIAQAARDGIVPDTRRANGMSDDELVEHLTSIKGVGCWTVEMLLIFRLGRPDVLPATDYGIQKGFALAKRMAKAFQDSLSLRVPVTLVEPGALPRFELKAKRWVVD